MSANANAAYLQERVAHSVALLQRAMRSSSAVEAPTVLTFAAQYDAADAVLDALTSSAMRVFERLGLAPTALAAARAGRRSLSVRFSARQRKLCEERYTYTTSDVSHVRQYTGGATIKDTLVTEHVRYRGAWHSEWSLRSFVGNAVEAGVVLVEHTAVEPMEQQYSPVKWSREAPQLDVDLSWLASGGPVDRVAAKTPRRNAQVAEMVAFATSLRAWCDAVAKELDFGTSYGNHGDSIFVSAVPLFVDGASVPRETLADEHARSISEQLALLASTYATVGPNVVRGEPEARVHAMVRHLSHLATTACAAVDELERLLMREMIAALGKTLRASDFDDYMRHHNQHHWSGAHAARPFCFPIARPGHDPEGVMSLETQAGELPTFSSSTPGVHAVQFVLNAATTVQMRARCHLHGFVAHQFGPGAHDQLQLCVRARQFSCYILLMGRLLGPTLFSPDFALLVMNKDDVEIALQAVTIPSAQEFAEAVESLSVDQQRFAKQFRAMQMASTLFAVAVVQLKPQLETLLHMPYDSLTKEIELTQHLMKLFAEFQIPPDLLKCRRGVTDSAAAVAQVKGHVSRVFDMVGSVGGPLHRPSNLPSLMDAMARERVALSQAPLELSSTVDPDEGSWVVLDLGGWTTKGGELSTRSPNAAVPLSTTSSCVGRPRHMGVMVGMGQKDSYAGESSPPSNALGDVGTAAASTSDAASAPASSPEASPHATTLQSAAPTAALRDFTQIPELLEKRFDALAVFGSVRPMILTPGPRWQRTVQPSIHSERRETQVIPALQQRDEKNLAFDLLDALSSSGGIELCAVDLHVIVGYRHCFEASLMATLVEDSVNPIEMVVRACAVMHDVIHAP